jgi:hypothetical protein
VTRPIVAPESFLLLLLGWPLSSRFSFETNTKPYCYRKKHHLKYVAIQVFYTHLYKFISVVKLLFEEVVFPLQIFVFAFFVFQILREKKNM